MCRATATATLGFAMAVGLLSCRADLDLDASFRTTVRVNQAENPRVFVNRIKFSLIDAVRPSLESFGIVPENVALREFRLVPNLANVPQAAWSMPVDIRVYIENVREQGDLTSENRTLLGLKTNVALGSLIVLDAETEGVELLKAILGGDDDLKSVLLTYELVFAEEPVSIPTSIDLGFTISASMEKTFDDIF